MKFLFMKKDFRPSYAFFYMWGNLTISKNMCLAFVPGSISCEFVPQFNHEFDQQLKIMQIAYYIIFSILHTYHIHRYDKMDLFPFFNFILKN